MLGSGTITFTQHAQYTATLGQLGHARDLPRDARHGNAVSQHELAHAAPYLRQFVGDPGLLDVQ